MTSATPIKEGFIDEVAFEADGRPDFEELQYSGTRFDEERASFLKGINERVKNEFGVSYLEIQQSIHPTNEAYKVAYEEGASPDDFAKAIGSDFGLKRVHDFASHEAARDYNLKAVAIVEFAGQSEDWSIGRSGVIYSETSSGIAIMKPVRDQKSERYGFGILHLEGAEMVKGRLNASSATEKGRFAAFDIDQAMEAYTASLEADNRPSL